MRVGFLWLMSTIGIYEILYQIWTYLETLELGTAYVSIVDTVMCFAISAVISLYLVLNV